MKTLYPICFALLTIFSISTAEGGRWIRYNLAGYDPVRTKKVVLMADDDCTGFTWRLRNTSNTVVLNGTLGAEVTGTGNYMPKVYNYEITFTSIQTTGNYTLEVDNFTTVPIKIACRPYAFILPQILRTIRVRRSGSADALIHDISHLGDNSCRTYDRAGSDNSNWSASADNKRVDMQGGFYDAGDYIKFTLTNAYLTYFMLRSYEEAPELFDGVKTYSQTSLDDLLDECKWGLDFLMKTMPDNDEFIIQTGGSDDHNQWPPRLPEDDALDGSRECYSAFSKTQMGLTAAALALGAKIFAAKGMTATATLYQNKAIAIYAKAKATSVADAWWQGGFEVYYADNDHDDNMQLAAIELYRLTNTNSYLTDAQTYAGNAGSAGWSSWANLNLTAHSRLYPYYNTVQSYITSDLNGFQTTANATNNRWGLPHASVWASLYSQFGVAHGALQFENVSGNTSYRQVANDVIDYTFGRNAWGLGFIATQSISGTITSSYATIYKLTGEFPHGEIAEGPAPRQTHIDNEPYFYPAHNASLWHAEFNTVNWAFFEQAGDYVCMETTITGLADGLFFISMASKMFCNTTLPVTFTSVDVAKENSLVKIDWSTVNEYNNAYFVIERSANGEEFTPIGSVQAVGTGNGPFTYSFHDHTPLPGTGFYRIRQVDIDGVSSYSPWKQVTNVLPTEIIVGPNPFSDYITIENANGKLENVQVVDVTGKIVNMLEISENSDSNISTEKLSGGCYTIVINYADRREVYKLLKE